MMRLPGVTMALRMLQAQLHAMYKSKWKQLKFTTQWNKKDKQQTSFMSSIKLQVLQEWGLSQCTIIRVYVSYKPLAYKWG